MKKKVREDIFGESTLPKCKYRVLGVVCSVFKNPDSLNPDPNLYLDPGIFLNTDLDPDQGFAESRYRT